MKRLGREVDTVRPHDGAAFGIDVDLAEVVGVLERLENARALRKVGQIDVTDGPILEEEPQAIVAEDGDPGDRVGRGWHEHILWERRDVFQGAVTQGPLPVGLQLRAM
jgi:hypothetical protein